MPGALGARKRRYAGLQELRTGCQWLKMSRRLAAWVATIAVGRCREASLRSAQAPRQESSGIRAMATWKDRPRPRRITAQTMHCRLVRPAPYQCQQDHFHQCTRLPARRGQRLIAGSSMHAAGEVAAVCGCGHRAPAPTSFSVVRCILVAMRVQTTTKWRYGKTRRRL